jgi:hypothetical protein
MSDTPETDEQEFLRMSDDWRFVNVEFARKMERQRNEARKVIFEGIAEMSKVLEKLKTEFGL